MNRSLVAIILLAINLFSFAASAQTISPICRLVSDRFHTIALECEPEKDLLSFSANLERYAVFINSLPESVRRLGANYVSVTFVHLANAANERALQVGRALSGRCGYQNLLETVKFDDDPYMHLFLDANKADLYRGAAAKYKTLMSLESALGSDSGRKIVCTRLSPVKLSLDMVADKPGNGRVAFFDINSFSISAGLNVDQLLETMQELPTRESLIQARALMRQRELSGRNGELGCSTTPRDCVASLPRFLSVIGEVDMFNTEVAISETSTCDGRYIHVNFRSSSEEIKAHFRTCR